MHTTNIKLKNGEVWAGVIWYWRPDHNYICFQLCGRLEPDRGPVYRYKRFSLDEMESCVTENERLSINKIGDCDELERARKHLVDSKKYNWPKQQDDAPQDELDEA